MPIEASIRSSLVRQLEADLRHRMDAENVTYHEAFASVAATYLGYDLAAPENRLSGKRNDYGIDFWQLTDDACTLFQFKAHDFTQDFKDATTYGPDEIKDVSRMHSLLETLASLPKDANADVVELIKRLRSRLTRLAPEDEASSDDATFAVTIVLCLLGKGLTRQASDEFRRLEEANRFSFQGLVVPVRYQLRTIDDLIAARWSQQNTKWISRDGKDDDHVRLTIVGGGPENRGIVAEPKSLVFFTRARDLTNAFERFGYQMFEPNVRCEIKRSKVNAAIKASAQRHRGRKEFRYLNNGITIVCPGFKKDNQGRHVVVTRPGIINGLQTVTALYEAQNEMSSADRDQFDTDCDVLVRLHTTNAVADYKDLVKSTNNQNPMRPRNLKSNEKEQTDYERMFADLGWFYERKEGAWQAFQSDSKLWTTLRGKKKGDFMSGKVARSVDNLLLAQSWLAFIGYASDAVHETKMIFESEDYYGLVFLSRLSQHGGSLGFKKADFDALKRIQEQERPEPALMLSAYLCWEAARKVLPSRRVHRQESIKRLGLETRSREEQEASLAGDPSYVKGLVQSGAALLFPEFVGLVLFKTFGNDVHKIGRALLANGSHATLNATRDYDALAAAIGSGTTDPADVLVQLWHLYDHCLAEVVSSPAWRQGWDTASVRTRFNYSEHTRTRLAASLDSVDAYIRSGPLTKPWARGFNDEQGVFAHFRKVLKPSKKR